MENVLHPGLGIVEVPLHGADGDIPALLGHHLGPLDLRDTALGVEYTDADSGHILEAYQSRLAGITGGGGEDADLLLDALFLLGGGEKLGQHAQSHILKGGGGAPEELADRHIPHGHRGGQVFGLEFAGVGILDQFAHIRNVRQQGREDHFGHALAALLQALMPVKGRNGFRHIKAAVRRKTVENCLSAVNGGGHSPGRNVIHSKTSCIFAQKKWKTKGKHCISLQLHFS